MSDQKCNLIFTGEIAEDKTLEEVHNNLAELFKNDIEAIQKRFGSQRSIIKKNADKALCETMLSALTNAGAICQIEPVEAPPLTATQPQTAQRETPANPYAAPQADLRTPPSGMTTGFTDPQKVSASRGAAWIFHALGLVKKSPFKWFLTMLLYFIVNLVQIIPFVGAIIIGLLGPAFTAGFIQGVKELDEDDVLRPTCMFYGFKQNFGQLLLFAIVYILLVVVVLGVVVGIMAALFGFNMAMFTDPQAMAGSSMAMVALVPLIALLFIIPLGMCYWFAPALIMINDLSVFEAMKMSFTGCLKNWLAFLVNGLVFLGIGIALTLLIGLSTGMLVFVIGEAGSVIVTSIITILAALILMPTFFGVIYSSYNDIFYD